MREKLLAEKLIDSAVLNGGETIPVGISAIPKKGYIVSVHNVYTGKSSLEHREVKKIDNDIKTYFINTYTEAVGSWIDTYNGLLYIDIVTIYNSLDVALLVTRENQELAIYDIASGQSINVK